MCIQIKTIFRCNCPHQNTPICPHSKYIRTTQEEIDKQGKYADNGFQLRLESALQAHRDWTPLPLDNPDQNFLKLTQPRWEHCSLYKARHQTEPTTTKNNANALKNGKESSCSKWIQEKEYVSKLVMGLCPGCVDGHVHDAPVTCIQKPSLTHAVKGRFKEEFDLEDSDLDVVGGVQILTPSGGTQTPRTGTSGRASQRTPVRKILNLAKQKIIRDGIASGTGTPRTTGSGGSGSTSPDEKSEEKVKEKVTSTGKDKDKVPDVFARLLNGATPSRRGSPTPESRSSTPVGGKGQRPVSRQNKGAGRGK